MPTLPSNSNDVQIRVGTTADNSGTNEAVKGLEKLGAQGSDTEKKLSSFTQNFSSNLNKVAAVTGVVGAGLSLYAKSSVDYLGDMVKSSKTLATQTGMNVTESSKLVAVMQRMGVGGDQAALSFRTLSKVITDSRENTEETTLKQEALRNKIEGTKIEITKLNKEITENGDSTGEMANKVDSLNLQLREYEQNLNTSGNALSTLGVKTVDAEGKQRDFYSILLDTADKFKEMPQGPEKTALALELFGRQGAGLIKILDQGSKGIEDMGKKAEELGLTLTESNVGAISDYVKSQKDLADSTNSIKIAVGTLTAPLLTEFNNALNMGMTNILGTDGAMRDMTVGVLAFGGPILGAISGVAAFAANINDAIPVFKGFAKMVQTPIVMPAIVVAAAIAALAAVIAKINEVNDAIAGAKSAARSLENEGASVRAKAQAKYDAGEMSEAAYKRTMQIGYQMEAEGQRAGQENHFGNGFWSPMLKSGSDFVNMVAGRNATGTNNWRGGPSWVGENGPELIDLPQGSKVYTNKDSQRLAQGGQTINIQTVVLQSGDAVDRFMNYKDQDAQMTQMGLSPSRGIA